MGWTAPDSPGGNQVLTNSFWETHVRDNLLETAPAKVTTAGDIVYATGANAIARLGLGSIASNVANWKTVQKSADTTRQNNTVAADPHLVFPIGANEVWILETVIFYFTGSTPDFRCGIYGPTGVTGSNTAIYNDQTAGTLLRSSASMNTTPGVDFNIAGGSSQKVALHIYSHVINGANAGDLALSWAQFTTDASNTTVYAGSFMRGVLVA